MSIIFSRKRIKEALKKKSKQINSYYKDINLDNPVVIIPILKGGIFFYTDLVRNLKFPNEMGLISTSHYPNGEETRELEIKFFDADVKDRYVLLVDEICYTGDTLIKLVKLCYEKGAKAVHTIVLVDQPDKHKNIKIVPDWWVLKYKGNKWIYGYGMDLNGKYREKLDILAD